MFRVLWEESAVNFRFLQILISRFNSAVRFEKYVSFKKLILI